MGRFQQHSRERGRQQTIRNLDIGDGSMNDRVNVNCSIFLAPLLMTLCVGAALAGPLGASGDLYVSSKGSDEVLQYDGVTGEFVGAFVTSGAGGLTSPNGLRFGPNGNLFVASQDQGRILEFNGDTGSYLRDFVAANGFLTDIHHIKFNDIGNLFVVNNSSVEEFNSAGTHVLTYDAIGFSEPRGLEFLSTGHLLVSRGDTVFKFDTPSRISVFANGGISAAQTMNWSSSGTLLVANNLSLVAEYSSSGEYLGQFVDAITSVGASTIGPNYNLFLCRDSATGLVLEFDGMTGEFARVFVTLGSGGLSWPRGMQFKPPNCPPLSIVQGNGGFGETRPFSGYVDPRIESTNGEFVNVGIQHVTILFSDVVDAAGGGDLRTDSFEVSSTGESPPQVASIDASLNPLISIQLDSPPPLNEWLTITAMVEDQTCGFSIESLGNLGPDVNEPDRIDFLFLPGDIDQNGIVSPFDLLRFRLIVNDDFVPERGLIADYVDINRSGEVTPLDLLFFRQLVNGIPPATQPWAGESANSTQP
jgi:hypothetical protein